MTVSSCSKLNTVQDCYQWINNPENGLVKERVQGNIKYVLKYIPAEISAIKELGEGAEWTQTEFNKVLAEYNESITFVLKIGPDPEHEQQFDIMMAGIGNYEGYAARIKQMNFGLKENLTLSVNGKNYAPVLAELESVYGISKHRNIYLVFGPSKDDSSFFEAEKYVLTYDDPIFDTGINHFVIQSKDIDNFKSKVDLKI